MRVVCARGTCKPPPFPLRAAASPEGAESAIKTHSCSRARNARELCNRASDDTRRASNLISIMNHRDMRYHLKLKNDGVYIVGATNCEVVLDSIQNKISWLLALPGAQAARRN